MNDVTIISYFYKKDDNRNRKYAFALCGCGEKFIARYDSLLSKKTTKPKPGSHSKRKAIWNRPRIALHRSSEIPHGSGRRKLNTLKNAYRRVKN